MVWPSLLSFLLLYCLLSTSPSSCFSSVHENPLCHPNESSALLSFKSSFPIVNDNSYLSFCSETFGNTVEPNSTIPWDIGSDCCGWSGVECDEVTGHVVGLHLGCGGLLGVMDSNNTLFSLTRLRTLVLFANRIQGSISPNFGRFAGMTHLDLSLCEFTGQVPRELAYLSNLQTLDLHWNMYGILWIESSGLEQIVSNLTNLEELWLGSVLVSGVLPSPFSNLSNSLTVLDLSYSGLVGEFPENIFHLPNLDLLYLGYNFYLTGLIPKNNWTSPVRYLDLSYCGVTIDLPHFMRNFKYLNGLYLSSCNLTGKFPSNLGDTARITSFDMSSNDFSGQIPWHFINLENLSFLDLSFNNFVGQLPEICTNSKNQTFLCDPFENQLIGPLPLSLTHLSLSYNQLNGTIPSWLYSLSSLEELFLSHNHFTGRIKEFKFNSLKVLRLDDNRLHGLVPRSIFHQVYLSMLTLSSNDLSGVVKMEKFSKLKSLQHLSLSFTSLSLVFIGQTNYTLPNFLSLHLSSCNITEFPYTLRSLKDLQELDLSNNRIEGSVPRWLQNVGKDSLKLLNISNNLLTHMGSIPWKNLRDVDLRSNQFQGHLPIPPLSTMVFFASNNQFRGEISTKICNLSSIEALDLSNNSLSGNILPCIGNLTNNRLSILDLRMNEFDGVIPSVFAKGNSLKTLNLNKNRLEGQLPESLVNCQSLEVLDVGNNKLNGSFPQWLDSLPELQVLILRSNRFHSVIADPVVRFPFQKLRIMDISDNKFTGFLPTKYFAHFKAMIDAHTESLKYMGEHKLIYYHDSVMVVMKGVDTLLVKIQIMFISIDFSSNNFIGGIPKLIGKLNSLKGLNLSHNKLTGPIPTSLGNLSDLEWLDLSSNELVGKIPWQLASNLNQLAFINLSVNHLEGPIPRGKQFDTFDNDSYSGNLGLCGFPLSEPCVEPTSREEEEGDDDRDHDDGTFEWKIATMGYACGVVIGVSLGYMVFFSRRFDYWLAKRIGRAPQLRRKTNARVRGRGRN